MFIYGPVLTVIGLVGAFISYRVIKQHLDHPPAPSPEGDKTKQYMIILLTGSLLSLGAGLFFVIMDLLTI